MAATMEAAMFIMINMHGYLCENACVHVDAYVHKSVTDSTNPNLQSPPPTAKGEGPLKTV